MRRYYDILIDYHEQSRFLELNNNWYAYLNQVVANNAHSFHLLQNFPELKGKKEENLWSDIVLDRGSISQFTDESSIRFSKQYQKLLTAAEHYLDLELQEILGGKYQSFYEYKAFKKRKADFQKINLSKSLAEWVQHQGLSETTLGYYSDKLKNKHDSLLIKAIEQFYDPYHHLNGQPIYHLKKIDGPNEIELQFDSLINYETVGSNFTKTDSELDIFRCDEPVCRILNLKAKNSPISVSGKLSQIEHFSVKANGWFNQELLNLFLKDHHNNFLSLGQNEIGRLINLFKKEIQTVYTAGAFDLEVLIKNQFNTNELKSLRNSRFHLFPFYFTSVRNFSTQVTHLEDGSLKIRLRSNDIAPIMFGATTSLRTEDAF